MAAKKKTSKAKKKGSAIEEGVLDDSRHIASRMAQHKAAFIKADAHRTQKILPPAFMKAFPLAVRAGTTIVGASASAEDTVLAATAREEKCRLALYRAIVVMRDEIAAAYPDDRETQRAFGKGIALSKRSTPGLRAAATRIQQNYEKSKALMAAAKAAGIGAPRMNELIALRRALTDANTSQQAAIKSRAALNAEKIRTLRALKRDSSRIRKAAGVVFRGQPAILGQFKTTIARRPGAKKKSKAKPPAPPTGSPPPAPATGGSSAAG